MMIPMHVSDSEKTISTWHSADLGTLPQPDQIAAAFHLKPKTRELVSSKVVLGLNEAVKSPHPMTMEGYQFEVHPHVFSPAIFPDTQFFAPLVAARAGGRFLEIGTGTGVIAALAAMRGASYVVATDINPAAVANAVANFATHKLKDKSDVRLGDVFEPLKKDEKFDVMFWNVPFMYTDREHLSMLEMALYDSHYRGLQKYMSGADKHLVAEGRVLIGFSSTHGHLEVLKGLAQKHGWTLQCVAEDISAIPASAEGADCIAIQLFEATRKNHHAEN